MTRPLPILALALIALHNGCGIERVDPNADVMAMMEDAQERLYDRALPSCFSVYQTVTNIDNERLSWTGAGFAWDDRHILTAAHIFAPEMHEFPNNLLSPAGNPVVINHQGVSYICDLVGIDLIADVALLRLPDGVSVRPIDQAADLPRHGAIVFHIGHPLGREHSISTGILSSVGWEHDRIDSNTNPGDSGSALLNKEGDVIGMVVGMTGTSGLCVPLARLKASVDRIMASEQAGSP